MPQNAFVSTSPNPANAEILAFPPRPPRNRFGVRERAETLRWAVVAGHAGLSKVSIENGTADPEIGDFVLVYEEGRAWASWGLSREEDGFVVWRTGVPGIIGRFETLNAALEAILGQPRRRRRRSTNR